MNGRRDACVRVRFASRSAPHQTRGVGRTRGVLDSRTVWRQSRLPTRRVALDDDPVAPMGVRAGMPARALATLPTRRGDYRDRRIYPGSVQAAQLLKALTR
jgi:hypothetical protein